jgi:hypothetical protein
MKSLKQYVAEGRPSQRHPLEGHEYHKKTDAELTYIAKDAHKAAEAMKSHNTAAENKYRDQANDSATVRYFRQKNGMPDWYKKKYGHVKEEVESIEELSTPTLSSYVKKVGDEGAWTKKRTAGVNSALNKIKKKSMKKEEVEQIDENLLKARQLYAQTYAKHAKTIFQSKDAKQKAYDTVEKKHGSSVLAQLKSHHSANEEVEQVDETKLVGILRHAEHGKAYIWQKPGEGGYNYEVEHTKTKKKEHHSKSHDDVVADLKSRGYKMNEEVDESYTGKGNHRPGWMLRADPKLGKKLKDAKKGHNALVKYAGKPTEKKANEEVEQVDEVAAWQRKEGKSESGGLNQKGVDSYRRENPGSKLSTAVTTEPSKLKAGSKAANRRKSFCARMGGMKKRLTSAKTARDPDSRINKALRKWNCN